MDNNKVNEVLNGFILKPIRLTYSYSKLQDQFKAGLLEILEAKKQYKEMDKKDTPVYKELLEFRKRCNQEVIDFGNIYTEEFIQKQQEEILKKVCPVKSLEDIKNPPIGLAVYFKKCLYIRGEQGWVNLSEKEEEFDPCQVPASSKQIKDLIFGRDGELTPCDNNPRPSFELKLGSDLSVDIKIQDDSYINNPEEILKLANLNPDEFKVTGFWRGFKGNKWWTSVKAQPIDTTKESGIDYLKAFTEVMENYERIDPPMLYPNNVENGEKLAVVCLFDIHLGKLGLVDYTGDCDITIGQIRFEFEKLFCFLKDQKVTKILLPLGNDFFNVDDTRLTTTHGTSLDSNPNLYRIYKSGLNLCRFMIEKLVTLAPVEVVLVAGNHATYTETVLVTSLAAIFKGVNHITVDDTPKDRKYLRFGKVLLGLTHGVQKPEKYAELLPFEAKEYFSECEHFEILVGDKHHEKVYKNPVIETGGVVVRQLGALSRKDVWHDKSGFVLAKRRSYVLIYDSKHGLELQYTNNAH